MTAAITLDDVKHYFANKLPRPRRRELEQACQTNAQVRTWFEDLAPKLEQIEQMPLPEVHFDAPDERQRAINAFLCVQRDEQRITLWREWLKNKFSASQAALAGLFESFMDMVTEIGHDALFLHTQVLPEMTGDGGPPPQKAPSGVPCIYPNRGADSLIIRLNPDQVPAGVVNITVVRRRPETAVEVLPIQRIELELMQPSTTESYWYADVTLSNLVKDFEPGDDLVYCVEAVHVEKPGSES